MEQIKDTTRTSETGSAEIPQSQQSAPVKAYVPPIPFPQRLQKKKLDKQFSKFLDVFKKLHINISFADALEQMRSYVKFMKEILSNKRKLEEHETVLLTKESTAILHNKLPPKLKDPGSFFIPCTIRNTYFDKALCDLGTSINLMPLFVFRKLGLGEPKATIVSLQLADRSIKYPRGMIEDVFVKVDKFIFPADFIVLDMIEDREIPIILGRPFLATRRTLIDVQEGKLILRVQDEQVTFNVFEAMKYPSKIDRCLQIDTIDKVIIESFCDTMPNDTLETCIVHSGTTQSANISIQKYAYLDDNSKLPVIISSASTDLEEEKLLRVLRDHKAAL
ncbi:uncharacterized protein LOC127899262 [Citrus sinensis]|uniref:uncharacterized protein LOC112096309 n=1 Tax=Citrus clementina TaxID=85681 RepID=UPI000CED2C3E|nr:uncharacterized protein LOC112096309 [Citrus x clementina]XP_052288560.1 uncharacterized protein LOC127899262 [Citrus sinensis]